MRDELWRDLLRLEDGLDAEERMLRDTAADFARKSLQPRVIAAFRDETFDRALLQAFGALGLLGIGLPGPGCPGGSQVVYGLVARETERIDSAYRSALSVQSSLVMFPILAYADEALRRHWLPQLARGSAVAPLA